MVITKTTKRIKINEKSKSVKKQKSTSKKKVIPSNSVKDIEIKWDRVLEKVEKMVEKDWEATEKDIIKRKSERNPDDYKDVNLDVMMSRISEQSRKQTKNSTFNTKNLLYFIYLLIIILIIIFSAKWLLMSQNG